jgi:hypothetical protein
LHDPVAHAVGDRLLGAHPVVPVGVLDHFLERLAGLAGDDLVDALAHLDDLARLDVDVGGRPAHAPHRLVQQEARVRQADPVLSLAGKEDQRPGAGNPAGADDADRHEVAHEADHVVDRVPALDMAAGRVDEHVDRALALAGQREQAAGDVAGDLVVDRAEDQHLALAEEPALELVDRRGEGAVVAGLLGLGAARLGNVGLFGLVGGLGLVVVVQPDHARSWKSGPP